MPPCGGSCAHSVWGGEGAGGQDPPTVRDDACSRLQPPSCVLEDPHLLLLLPEVSVQPRLRLGGPRLRLGGLYKCSVQLLDQVHKVDVHTQAVDEGRDRVNDKDAKRRTDIHRRKKMVGKVRGMLEIARVVLPLASAL